MNNRQKSPIMVCLSVVDISFFIRLVSLLMLTSLCGFSKPPEQPRANQFSKLWVNSPFTIKLPPARAKVATPLERDWSLGSIRPNGDKTYSVTLINKKNRKKRVRFIPGFSTGEFKLLDVKQDIDSPKMSKVLVSKKGQKAWIGYDKKVVALKVSKSVPKRISRHSSRKGPPIPRSSSSRKPTPRVRHVPRGGKK